VPRINHGYPNFVRINSQRLNDIPDSGLCRNAEVFFLETVFPEKGKELDRDNYFDGVSASTSFDQGWTITDNASFFFSPSMVSYFLLKIAKPGLVPCSLLGFHLPVGPACRERGFTLLIAHKRSAAGVSEGSKA